ncbi:hypothetical protein Hs30E_03830 [Lactococcus hodotermopsidis]|uniref:Uncharacterized protein n=2 Tax=Pseudolactococcus hodotermopsidis TaxID=2709157 RepID=A0A6A0B909_9LACT|nr:hypothetical protein Hs30E_03830 [Lactococcus hodotermopsidis]
MFVLTSFLLTLFIGNNVIMCSIYALEEKRMGRGNYYQVIGIKPTVIVLSDIIPWLIVSFISTIQSYCVGFVISFFAVMKNNIKTTFYIFSVIQFSRAIYPVDYIPRSLRYLVYANPFFYGIDGFRQLLHLKMPKSCLILFI